MGPRVVVWGPRRSVLHWEALPVKIRAIINVLTLQKQYMQGEGEGNRQSRGLRYNLSKNKRSQYPAILTGQAWSIKDLKYRKRTLFPCGLQRVIPSAQERTILTACVANHSVEFSLSYPLTEMAYNRNR